MKFGVIDRIVRGRADLGWWWGTGSMQEERANGMETDRRGQVEQLQAACHVPRVREH